MCNGVFKAEIVTTTNGTNPTFTNTIQAEPYGFVLSGYYWGSGLGRQGQDGELWPRASAISNDNHSRLFVLWSDTATDRFGIFNFQYTDNKFNGRAVRCVLTSIYKDV